VISARPPKVTHEAVREIMSAPPYWLAGSYLPAWRAGRISTAALVEGEVFGVTQGKPEEHPLHRPQLAVHPQVDAF
jgi:hypothetical protein